MKIKLSLIIFLTFHLFGVPSFAAENSTTYSTNPINEPGFFASILNQAADIMGYPLTRDETIFFAKNPATLITIRDITKLSLQLTSSLCLSEDPRGKGDGTAENAVLHFLWSFFLTGVLGRELATEFLMAHELVEKLSPATFMDLHNNELGSRFALEFGISQVRSLYFERNQQKFVQKLQPVILEIRQNLSQKQFLVIKSSSAESLCRMSRQ